jgi:hypothetical protein
LNHQVQLRYRPSCSRYVGPCLLLLALQSLVGLTMFQNCPHILFPILETFQLNTFLWNRVVSLTSLESFLHAWKFCTTITVLGHATPYFVFHNHHLFGTINYLKFLARLCRWRHHVPLQAVIQLADYTVSRPPNLLLLSVTAVIT